MRRFEKLRKDLRMKPLFQTRVRHMYKLYLILINASVILNVCIQLEICVYQQANSYGRKIVAHSGIEPETSINQSPYALPTEPFRLNWAQYVGVSYILSFRLNRKYNKGVGEGGAGGARAPPLSKVGGHKWVCAPPLLGRANVLISLFAHILWLKTHFFQNFLGSLRSPTLLNQYFLNFANLKL